MHSSYVSKISNRINNNSNSAMMWNVNRGENVKILGNLFFIQQNRNNRAFEGLPFYLVINRFCLL